MSSSCVKKCMSSAHFAMGRHAYVKSKTLPSSQHMAGPLYPTTNPNRSKTVQATDGET